jgi:hypothetical protein
VRVATTSALYSFSGINYTTYNTFTQIDASDGPLELIDGIPLVVGDRLLLKNESSSHINGIYQVVSLGDGSTVVWQLRRTDDANENAEVSGGMYTYVETGMVNGEWWFII